MSIPVSIREFPVYALRMLATVRAALLPGRRSPIPAAARHRLPLGLERAHPAVAARPGRAARIAAVREFCDDRSFDISCYPGIDVAAARANIYNDLPAVSFDAGEVSRASGPDDAIADEAGAVLRRPADAVAPRRSTSSPITLDRPFFYAMLRLDQLGTILSGWRSCRRPRSARW